MQENWLPYVWCFSHLQRSRPKPYGYQTIMLKLNWLKKPLILFDFDVISKEKVQFRKVNILNFMLIFFIYFNSVYFFQPRYKAYLVLIYICKADKEQTQNSSVHGWFYKRVIEKRSRLRQLLNIFGYYEFSGPWGIAFDTWSNILVISIRLDWTMQLIFHIKKNVNIKVIKDNLEICADHFICSLFCIKCMIRSLIDWWIK